MTQTFDPKDYIGLVKHTARRVYCHRALRRSLSLEDVEQEMWLVWTRATQLYDPAKGANFATYFMAAGLNRGIRLSKMEGRHIYEDSFRDGAAELEDENATGADDVIETLHGRLKVAAGDPRVALILRLLTEDSDILRQEDEALKAKTAYARTMGFDRKDPGVNLPALFKLIGVSRQWGYKMIGELKESIHGHD